MQKVFEKIIEAIRKNSLFMIKPDGYGEDCISEYTAIEIVKQEAEQYNNGWISFSERLPETGEMVLGLSNDGDIWLYNFRKWDSESGGFYRNIINQYAQSTLPDDSVIAWQPLPDQLPNTYKQKKTNFDRCCESMEAMAQIIDIAKIGWTREQIMEWLQSESEE